MKGYLAIGLILIAGLVTACGDASSETATTTSGTAGAEAPAGSLDVRLITIAPTDVGSWDPTHYHALSKVAKKKGWKLEVAEAVPYGEADQVFGRWGDKGVDIVFSDDSGFNDSMVKAAKEYPDTDWVVLSDLGSNGGLSNAGAYAGDWCQFAYVQGAIAGLATTSGKVGIVSGLPNPVTPQMKEGVKVGANTTREGTEVRVGFSGDWVDPTKKAEAASSLVRQGADVLIAFDTVNVATAARAEKEGVKYVGSWTDESKLAPNATVSSVVIDFAKGYEKVGDAVAAGKFQGDVIREGVATDYFRFLPLRLEIEGKDAEVKAAVEKLIAGEVTFPADGPCDGHEPKKR